MKLLIVVDMQNDFIDGALGTKDAVAIVPAVKAKIEEYRSMNNQVVFTYDTHQSNYLETQEGKNLPVVHCVENTEGWQISDKLEVAQSKVFKKPSFGSLELAEYVATISDLEEIELVGLCTDICVISNAMLCKTFLTETPVYIAKDCCAGVTPESHENALKAMEMCQIKIV